MPPHKQKSLAVDELRKAVRDAVAKHLDLRVYELFIFGSEASRAASPRSDIDIGIKGPRPVAKATIQRIRDELETIPTLRVFDVVDLNSTDRSFREEALRHAERI